MRILFCLLIVGLTLTVTAACNSTAAPTAPTPTPTPAPVVTTPTPLLPVLALEPDTGSPVGESVAITYGSRSQEAGKIVIAVTGFNLTNQRSATAFGVRGVIGAVRVDDAVLEFDAYGFGALLGGNDGATFCDNDTGGFRSFFPDVPGIYPFCVLSRSPANVTGSGELILIRFKPRPGVTSATTRVELVPFQSNGYTTTLDMLPGPSTTNKIQNTYGATVTIRPGT